MKFGDKVFITDRCEYPSLRGKVGIFIGYYNDSGLAKIAIEGKEDISYIYDDELLVIN
jgi:hypothetical protein